MVQDLVNQELEKIDSKILSKPEWRKKCADLGYVVAGVATKLKPTIDLLMPQGFEYTLPYGCLMLIFTVSILYNPIDPRLIYLHRALLREETRKILLSRS